MQANDPRIVAALMTFAQTVVDDVVVGLVLLHDQYIDQGRTVEAEGIAAAIARALRVAGLREVPVDEERANARSRDPNDLFVSALKSLIAIERTTSS